VSPKLAQRFRLATDPTSWRASLTDARWRRDGSCAQPSTRATTAQCTTVYWPTRYQHPNAAPFGRPIRDGLGAIAKLVAMEIDQPYEGIIIFAVDIDGDLKRVAIDYFDFTFVHKRCASEVDTYFKLQYLPQGYPDSPNVLAGGYVTSSSFLYTYWCRLRALRDKRSPSADVFARFGLRYSTEIRRAAINLLDSDPRIAYGGGTRPTRHSVYLREMATAKVCVDMPGQGPFCYRLVECLAMGCCIVGPRHKASLPVSLSNGVEIIYCADDLSDLVDLCASYAQDEARRKPVEVAAAKYFDDHLHPIRIAERYLTIICDR